MAADKTYEPIATNTLGSNATSVTFSSISSNYTDLVLVCHWKANTNLNATILLTFNGTSMFSTEYSGTQIWNTGGSVASGRNTNNYYIAIARAVGAPAVVGDVGTYIINIMDYANTNTYKTILARASSPDTGAEIDVGIWRNTNAITSVKLEVDSNGIATGSKFTLYGIKAA